MILLLIALGILVLAIWFQMGLLFYAGYTLAGIFIFSRWITRNWADQLVAVRVCAKETAEVGETVMVKIEIKNNGWIPITWMLVEDLLPPAALVHKPPSLGVTGDRVTVAGLKPGETKELNYQMNCNRRGYYQIGPLVLETGDLFGLHRRFRVLSTPNYILVFPRTIPLVGYDVSSKRPIGEVRMSYRIFEDPTRISGIRAYQQGDPLRRVHWRASARTGELQCKTYEPSTVIGATILLDFHKESFDPKHQPMRSELAITAAASIAHTVFQMGQQIGLLSNGRDAVDRIRFEGWRGDARTRNEAKASAQMRSKSDRLRPVVIPTRQSNDQLPAILSGLGRLEISDGMPLPEMVIEASSRIPRDATVIAILTRMTPEIAVSLGNLQKQGFSVSAIINVHDVDRFAKMSGPLLVQGIETRHLSNEDSIMSICERRAASMV